MMRVRDVEGWLRQRLLPPTMPPGAMPFFSLSYLLMLLFPAVIPNFPYTNWGLTAITALVFVPMYFLFFWTHGWRRIALLAAMVGLGLALLPANRFANTFIIYATILGAHLTVRGMLIVFAIAHASTALALSQMNGPVATILMVNMLSGGLAMFGCRLWYGYARKNEALRLSQAELQRVAALAERERIGRDLHDLLGHTLSVVALKSELAGKLIERDPAAARAQILDVETVAREALAQVREAVAGIRATGLEAELVSARLALLSADVKLDQHLVPFAIDTRLEQALALAVREAVTNVIRHAGAQRVEIELVEDHATLRLSIADDGRGGIERHGNGLSGMRERIEAVGGTIEVESARGAGTRLVLRVPRVAVEGAAP
jgi:two-component system sensor histidine kinase DesK